jgi:hypothetical protein
MRRKVIITGLTTLTMLLLSGCGASGPKFEGFKKPSKGKANVYIYRTSYAGAAVVPDIHKTNLSTNKDEVIGSVEPNGYIMTTVKPDKYKFWAKTEVENEVQLKANPDEIYCIEHYISIGFLIGHPQFKLVDMEKCKKEIEHTNLSSK